MLQHNENLYLPTKKLYSVLDDSAYQQAKSEHLATLFPGYANKTLFEKWKLLIDGMKDRFTSQEMPVISEGTPPVAVQLTTETCKERFENFRIARQNTSVSYYNLTLEQCVAYFEDFCFLYTIQNPNYKLRNAEKISLIKSILEAMGHCETGINGRFYAVLQEHQKDTNWIASEITKARCEALRRLGQTYNTQRNIDDALNIHTFDTLVDFANADGLGIPQKEKIWDIFAFLMNKRDLKNFFNKQRSRHFQDYERQLETTLQTHIFSELILAIPNINTPQWGTHATVISEDEITDFTQFMSNYFPVIGDGATDHFIVPNDEYTECKIKSKPECITLIRDMIRRKLIADEYYVDITAAQERDRGNLLKLHNDLTIEKLLNYMRALNQEEHNPIAQRQAELLINTYPELLYQAIRRQPEFLNTVKPWIKSTLHTDQLIKIFDEELIKTITQGDQQKIIQLVDNLFTLIHPDCDYILQLSPEVLANPHVMTALFAKDGGFLAYFPQNMWGQYEDLAFATNSFAMRSMGALLINPNLLPNSSTLSSMQKVQQLNRLRAIKDLTQTPHIDIQTFGHMVRHITPQDLVNIIRKRKHNRLISLPFCSAKNIERSLEKFYTAAKTLGNEWEENNYLALKKKACERQRDYSIEGDEIAYIARSSGWFMGFVQYQQNRVKSANIWAQTKMYLKALVRVILYMALLYMMWHFTWIALPYFSAFSNAISVPGPIFWLASTLINVRLRHRGLATFNYIVWHLITLDWQFLKAMFIFMLASIYMLVQSAVQFLKIVPFVIETLIQVIDTPAYFRVAQTEQPWLEKCDQIICRLKLQDEPAAEQKAILLQTIKDRFAMEERPNDEQLVHKKYPVTYQGRVYEVSFSEVAKQRRDKTETFSLEPVSKIWCGLFTVATSSENLLPQVEEVAGLGMV